MQVPTYTENEECRLASLHALRLLDTDPEERFDRITRLAKRLFNVPIALISLVDSNRQWFKSTAGLDVRQTPRDISFCGHAIHENKTFVVEDAHTDSRFFDNPLVTDSPYIRFYAGHPITAPNGYVIGTLCIIDSKQRVLTQDDKLALTDLANLVSDEFISLQLATIDDLTQITNRRGFKRLAQHCIDICARQNNKCHLAYFDLDHFKEINDNYGHLIGDQVLVLFARQMLETFRVSDICARIGGDEFVALLTNSQLNSATQAIERFANNLTTKGKSLPLPHNISFSYGLASYDANQSINIDFLLDQADKAMYVNKQKSKHTSGKLFSR